MRSLVGFFALIPGLTASGAAYAQTFSVQSVVPAELGTLAAASTGTTIFQAYNGTLKISGDGAYLSGTQTTSVVTIGCSGACNGATARVDITRTGVNTGRGQTITDMGVIASGATYLGGATTNASGTLSFTMTGWTAPGNLQFQLGIRLPVLGDDSSTATFASSQFNVAVAVNGNTPVGGTTSTISGTIRKALTLVKNSDLRFGTVLKPASGSYQVYISDTDGSRGTTPGSALGNLVPSTFGPATYSLNGQPGTTFSLAFPSTLTMSGPATLSATLVGTLASGSYTLPASGTLNLVIGSYVAIASTTATGAYSGTFNVTLTYN